MPHEPDTAYISLASGPAFEAHIRSLAATRARVNSVFATLPDSKQISEATLLLLWQSLFNSIYSGHIDDLLKSGSLIEKLYCALTQRQAVELRAEDKTTSKPPLDAPSFASLEKSLHIS